MKHRDALAHYPRVLDATPGRLVQVGADGVLEDGPETSGASGLPAIPADWADVPYVLGILGGAAAWRVLTGSGTLGDGLLAPDGAVLLAPDGGALTPT